MRRGSRGFTQRQSERLKARPGSRTRQGEVAALDREATAGGCCCRHSFSAPRDEQSGDLPATGRHIVSKASTPRVRPFRKPQCSSSPVSWVRDHGAFLALLAIHGPELPQREQMEEAPACHPRARPSLSGRGEEQTRADLCRAASGIRLCESIRISTPGFVYQTATLARTILIASSLRTKQDDRRRSLAGLLSVTGLRHHLDTDLRMQGSRSAGRRGRPGLADYYACGCRWNPCPT